ncbi:hypothetical protein EZV62_013905 [Acer yangbiense]|uniref:Uncharacterized protein n=1 Tax=Acer yangbiense TaxID=1000413 RepID=A0A5C7HT22_9ROSI|nr:hypothetical protein EZV62_013905 [Acer yangbiense]
MIGLPSSQMFNMLMSTLYKQFAEKEIHNFEDFHEAFLDIFNTVNSALPGKHYDVPSRKDVEECYNKWERYPEAERKIKFVEFMKKTMKLSSLDDVTIKTGIVTPPAAMAIKKAGQNVPQMKMIKAIPDVIFVPSITLIALISAKLSRKIIQRKSSPRSSLPPPLQLSPQLARYPTREHVEAPWKHREEPQARYKHAEEPQARYPTWEHADEPWNHGEEPQACYPTWEHAEEPQACYPIKERVKEPQARYPTRERVEEPQARYPTKERVEEPQAHYPPSPPYQPGVKEASRTWYY